MGITANGVLQTRVYSNAGVLMEKVYANGILVHPTFSGWTAGSSTSGLSGLSASGAILQMASNTVGSVAVDGNGNFADSLFHNYFLGPPDPIDEIEVNANRFRIRRYNGGVASTWSGWLSYTPGNGFANATVTSGLTSSGTSTSLIGNGQWGLAIMQTTLAAGSTLSLARTP